MTVSNIGDSAPHPRQGGQPHPPEQGIGQVFSSLNRKFLEDEVQRKAKKVGLPYFDLKGFPIEQAILELVNVEDARAAEASPFYREGHDVKVGLLDPNNPNLQKIISPLEHRGYRAELYLVSAPALEYVLGQYRRLPIPSLTLKHEATVKPGVESVAKLRQLPALAKEDKVISASDLVEIFFAAAVTMRASDIHLEPEKNLLKIRFRIDGVLQDMVDIPSNWHHLLVTRLKVLSSMKLNVTASTQDGRFSVRLPDKVLDIRVSALPSAYGESIVMRILGNEDLGVSIAKLGLIGRASKIVSEELQKPNGMILTTGPTGSGKTTTLYSFLQHLNKPGIKIITLEDPVEYRLEGVIQTPIDHASGMDFAKGLRSILRQDPDIIMVGEIRDYETAETASQAALTGHVVLSTLHTNDAAGAIPRLLDMGVKPVTLAPALNALIAQRLVRRLCEHCKETYRPAPEEMRRVKSALEKIPPKAEVTIPETLSFFRGKGCEECHHLGYHGRIGVFEIFSVDDELEKMIYQQVSTVDIKRAAVAQGMMSMQQDGVLKALQGITDLSEVWRVTEE